MLTATLSDFKRAKIKGDLINYKDYVQCPLCLGETNEEDLNDFGCCILCDKMKLDI